MRRVTGKMISAFALCLIAPAFATAGTLLMPGQVLRVLFRIRPPFVDTQHGTLSPDHLHVRLDGIRDAGDPNVSFTLYDGLTRLGASSTPVGHPFVDNRARGIAQANFLLSPDANLGFGTVVPFSSFLAGTIAGVLEIQIDRGSIDVDLGAFNAGGDIALSLFAPLVAPAGSFSKIAPGSWVALDRSFVVTQTTSLPRPAYPVVFVHGTCSNNSTWSSLSRVLETGGWQFGGSLVDPVTVDGLLQNPTADFYLVQFTDPLIQVGLEAWASELNLYLRRISTQRTGSSRQSRFIVVAHSAGGLAAREYLQLQSYVGNIHHLITYGTPHLGIPIAAGSRPWVEGYSCTDAPAFATSVGIAQMNTASSFLQSLNAQAFPPGVSHTSLIGNSGFCSALVAGQNDCVVSTTSANIQNVDSPPAPGVASAWTTSRSHWNETSDAESILWAVGRSGVAGSNSLRIQVASPIDIVLEDPNGRTISKTSNTIPLAIYDEIVDTNGERHDTVTVPFAVPGEYIIQVVPEPGSAATDTYGLAAIKNDKVSILADGVRVEDAPAEGYRVTVAPELLVSIDVKPGSQIAPINLRSAGLLPVVILSTPELSSQSDVDASSLTFGRSGFERSLAFCNDGGEDLNGDGRLDLVCHFATVRTDLLKGDTTGVLRGSTRDGRRLRGQDAILVR